MASMEEAMLDCQDVAALDPLDENAVVSFIGARYREAPVGQPPKHHLIYTRAGPVIVALNPLSPVQDLYTPAQRALYSKVASERAKAEKESRVIEDSDLPPHVYEVSAKTYCGMRDGRSQAVVINGESGAGKTETAKILLQDLSEKAGDGADDLALRLLASSPVLEAFGNAKTARNDNSSRFGKLIKLHFSPTGGLSHATVAHYLLEKSRVVSQQESEQAYHVAYYLLHGAPAALRASLHLTGAAADAPASPASPGAAGAPGGFKLASGGSPASWRYVRPPPATPRRTSFVGGSPSRLAATADGHGYEAAWRETSEALATMLGCGVDDEPVGRHWRMVAATLHLGQIDFTSTQHMTQDASAELSDAPASQATIAAAAAAAELLGCTLDELARALCTKVIMGGEVARTPREADVARHTLAKATYERLFDALVAEINGALAPADEVQGPTSSGTSSGPPTSATMGGGMGGGYRRELFVGLLDIFGSEVLEVNGFEQLMINYANDKLQFFFTQARA